MGLFKTSGTFNGYVHTLIGNDSTGDGTRNNPWATMLKAHTTLGSNVSVLLNGMTVENHQGLFSHTDNSESGFQGNLMLERTGARIETPTRITGNLSCYTGQVFLAKFARVGGNIQTFSLLQYSVCLGSYNATNIVVESKNNTLLAFKNYITVGGGVLSDSIIILEVDLYNFSSRSSIANYPIFKNCLFRKATLWKWNGATITINWTNNPVGGAAYTTEPLMQRVYNSLLYYANNTVTAGTDRTYAQAILATQATMFIDSVVYDDTDTVSNPIFSRYVGGVPVDYTLVLKSNNPALYMSTVGSYVGCYAANVNDDGTNLLAFGKVKNVTVASGVDTAAAGVEDGTLLIQDVSNQAKFSASQSSTQLWNRIRTSVVAYPRGKSFAGMQSQLDSGLASRLFFGKRQEIRTSGDISQKTTAFESVEVIPYDSIPANNTALATIDTLNVAANIPRFSSPFNGECLMFYKAGVPLLFNALLNLFQGAGTVSITSGSPTVTGTGTAFIADFVAGDNIRINGVDYTVLTTPTSNTALTLTANVAATLSAQSYYVGVKTDKSTAIYGTWAVTNADIESYSLLQKVTKAGLTTSIPLIKYAKFELNLHYDEE